MPRIRTIKPEFFRHEILQELENMHPELRPMLVFCGLWTQCDNQGIFQDKPRTLKLDILPFIDFDISKTLDVLHLHGFIDRYEIEGEQYGQVKEFRKHQRITGREAGEEGAKYPDQHGNIGETTGKQQGNNMSDRKGKERKRKGKEYTVEFERFWTAYPRKTKKGAAAEVWNRDELDGEIERVLETLDAYKRTSQWNSEGGKYIPYPSTWLNGKCYDDEPMSRNDKSLGRNLAE